jgi:succinate dehydrogenase/fumarate reductase cytochrome b subunit
MRFNLFSAEPLMLGKIIIIGLMLAIVFSLFQGLFYLVRGKDKGSKKVVNALSWRIGLSILLFILLFVFDHFGIIQLHSLSQAAPATP